MGAAKTLRQLSEHGTKMIQGESPRLEDSVQLEEFGEQKVMLHLMFSLHDCQASKVGINQILNSLMSETEGFHSCTAL